MVAQTTNQKLGELGAISEQGSKSLKVTANSSDLRKFSDAWEFQENEFMRAKERLRSIKANLAVLEGKMALAIMYIKFVVDGVWRIDPLRPITKNHGHENNVFVVK
ncbi:hypothetical protein MIMGU_mgv11b020794mg [Erythranthe guttata]|uniref:AMP-activated protein kinase glycogen-binding domain-containing protein n=1 Tax=Erythranthe guttata TaxID=4155 RepID=A0A022QL62_ERYGU|nr:hypothetical protein MIMGU_mgv11b020794mg [Erythranthe guttata]